MKIAYGLALGVALGLAAPLGAFSAAPALAQSADSSALAHHKHKKHPAAAAAPAQPATVEPTAATPDSLQQMFKPYAHPGDGDDDGLSRDADDCNKGCIGNVSQ